MCFNPEQAEKDAADRKSETLVDCGLRNEAHGINYGRNRDYDGKGSEEEVIWLLKIALSD